MSTNLVNYPVRGYTYHRILSQRQLHRQQKLRAKRAALRDFIVFSVMILTLVGLYNKVDRAMQDSYTPIDIARAESFPDPIPTSTPTPTPSPIVKAIIAQAAPRPTSAPLPVNEVTIIIDEIFGSDSERAKRVAFSESGFRSNAKNPNSSAKGIYQIINGTWSVMKCSGDPYNARDNIMCAKKLYDHENGRFSTSFGWEASYHSHGQK